MNRKQRKEQQRAQLAVYLVDQAYGGPAEGGWYFDCGELQYRVGSFYSQDRAFAACRAVNDHLHATVNVGRRPISSVLSEGVYECRVEDHPAPLHFPQHRPHYE